MARIKLKCNSGVTLIELLIAMIVTLIIIGALVTAFISHTQTSATEEARMEVQQNLRVAVDRVSHVLSHAGFVCYDSFEAGDSMTGDDPENNTVTFDSIVNDASTDSLIVIYGFKSLGEVKSIDIGNDTVEIETVDDEDISPKLPKKENGQHSDVFKEYLAFFPNTEGNVFYHVDYADGKTIYFHDIGDLSEIKYYVDAEDNDSVVYVYMVSPARIKIDHSSENPALYLQNFAYDSDQHWMIAENITDIQFEYDVSGQGWEDDPSDEAIENQNIRKIKFTVWGEKEVNGETIRMKSQGEVSLRNAF